MTIHEVISTIDELGDETVVYARKIDGEFKSSSEVVLLELREEELGLLTRTISEQHCPGFDYFLEVFLVKEVLQDIQHLPDYETVEQQVKRVIYYAEFDA